MKPSTAMTPTARRTLIVRAPAGPNAEDTAAIASTCTVPPTFTMETAIATIPTAVHHVRRPGMWAAPASAATPAAANSAPT
jgi:hypothetical protein